MTEKATDPAPALLITGGSLVDPATGDVEATDVLLADGRVVSTAPPGRLDHASPAEHIDATDLLISPGLIDLQVNGAAGIDITSDPERLWQVAATLPRHGVTSFLPTLVTTDPLTRSLALRTLAAGRPDGTPVGARPLGLHFEGPMLSPERPGAHEAGLLRPPSAALVEGWSRDAGVAMVTIAPELPGAVEVIEQLARRGVLVSIGHTAAGIDEVRAAIAAGARAVTHLFNAMPGLESREPGPVGAALAGELVAGVIVDGLHVHPLTVAAAYKALGRTGCLLVSDATAALGQPTGTAWLGGRRVVIGHGEVRLEDGGGLAGSAVGLDRCVRLLAEYAGLDPAQALAAATTVPAGLLGRPALGRLTRGAVADVVLFDQQLVPMATVADGHLVHDWRSSPAPEWTASN